MKSFYQGKAPTSIPIRAIIGFVIFFLLNPVCLFLAAGDAGWPMGWAYSGLFIASIIGSRLATYLRSPDLLRERARFMEAEGVKAWDRVLVFLVGLVGPLAIVIVAGLDRRFGWSASVPFALQVGTLVGVALGYGVAIWAMLENAFFSAVVRIQHERGHVVVSTGPYAIIRHPAYAGGILSSLAIPIVLDSLYALIPALAMVILLIVRTSLEDKTLHQELPGYTEYAARVKHRLVPGMW